MLFPSSPVVGQTYVLGLKSWRWNGSAWAAVINQGQIVSVLVSIGPFVDIVAALPEMDRTFNLITYV